MRLFQQANSLPHCSTNLLSSSLTESVNWCKPPVNMYKVNSDVACNSSIGKIGIGIIVRNCIGKVCGTFQACLIGSLSPLSAKALGLLHAVIFCKNAGLSRIILEGDSLQVITFLKQQSMDLSEAGMLVSDAISLLESFDFWFASHVKRVVNSIMFVQKPKKQIKKIS